jgi:hypothetical protein
MISAFLMIWLSAGNAVLDRAAASAQALWDQLPAVQCLERIVQNRATDSGKFSERSDAIYDYVLFLKTRGASLLVEESRVRQDRAKEVANATFLKTSGFPTLLFLFHPAFRDRFEFDEPDRGNDQGVVRIGFRQKLELPGMAALKVQDRTYPIHWKGSAWVEEQTGKVIQITAELVDPSQLEVLGIRQLRADVTYAPVRLTESQRGVNLPNRAVIKLSTARQQWENVHEFSNYRIFSFTTTTRPPGTR